MSLQVFLNFIMVAIIGGALGVLYWTFRYWKLLGHNHISRAIMVDGLDTTFILKFALFRCVIVGLSIGLLIASFISW